MNVSMCDFCGCERLRFSMIGLEREFPNQFYQTQTQVVKGISKISIRIQFHLSNFFFSKTLEALKIFC